MFKKAGVARGDVIYTLYLKFGLSDVFDEVATKSSALSSEEDEDEEDDNTSSSEEISEPLSAKISSRISKPLAMSLFWLCFFLKTRARGFVQSEDDATSGGAVDI